MDLNSESRPTTLTLGLYTPYLQGFYIGELVNQIRQLCFIKGYRLIIIRTGGYGKFASNIHLNEIDGAIVIRNAVSAEFAETLLALQKPCVSIAYDYFPLPIPVVLSDNHQGINLAMEHLLHLGHKKIAFVGDLSQYDLRKRYEYYCEAHDQFHLEFREDYLFTISDSQFSGGRIAAQNFLTSGCDATGLIFGAGLTGMGFIQLLQNRQPELAKQVAYVCFDALPLIPVFTPQLASIDQNLHLIAYRSINGIESLLAGKELPPHTLIQPKLTKVSEDPDDRYDAFIATCVDLPEFHNPNYAKSIISNMYDWPREIAENQLDQIMSLAPLFARYMDAACLARHFIDNNQNRWLKQLKIFLPGEVLKIELTDSSSLCKAEKFPPASLQQHLAKDIDFYLHMPIQVGGRLWGFLSLFGRSVTATPASSFLALGGYIETVVHLFEQDLEIKSLLQKQMGKNPAAQTAIDLHADRNAGIRWDFDNGITHWSELALQKLGFTSAVELNIYSTMDITDRIHKDYLETIRQYVTQCKNDREPFQAQLKYKMKNGSFNDAVLAGEAIIDSEQKMTGIQFYLGVANEM